MSQACVRSRVGGGVKVSGAWPSSKRQRRETCIGAPRPGMAATIPGAAAGAIPRPTMAPDTGATPTPRPAMPRAPGWAAAPGTAPGAGAMPRPAMPGATPCTGACDVMGPVVVGTLVGMPMAAPGGGAAAALCAASAASLAASTLRFSRSCPRGNGFCASRSVPCGEGAGVMPAEMLGVTPPSAREQGRCARGAAGLGFRV